MTSLINIITKVYIIMSREQGKAMYTLLERETLELSWTGLKPKTTRFLGQCSTEKLTNDRIS